MSFEKNTEIIRKAVEKSNALVTSLESGEIKQEQWALKAWIVVNVMGCAMSRMGATESVRIFESLGFKATD